MKRGSKRGLSGVVVSILLILLALVAVVVVWTLVTGFMNKTAQGVTITQFTNNVQVDDAKIGLSAAKIKITRTTGDANITALRFIFNDETNIYQYDQTSNLPQQKESRTYEIPLGNGTKTSATIKVIPIFGKTIGIENKITPTVDLTTATNTGLVAYWKFEGDAKDSSGNGYDGTCTSCPTYSQGKIGLAGNFSTNLITLNNGAIGNPNNELTYLFWFKTDNNDDTHKEILRKTLNGGNMTWFFIYRSGHGAHGKLGFEYNNATATVAGVVSQNALNNGVWHFAALVRKGDYNITLYIDNETSRTIISPRLFDSSTSPILIGQNFKGTIDELVIFNRTLSDLEIKQIYDSQK